LRDAWSQSCARIDIARVNIACVLFVFSGVSRLIADPDWFYPFYIWYFRQDHAIEGAKFLSARCCHDRRDAVATMPRRTRAFMHCLTQLYTLFWGRRWQKG
jgi:hypothetical protein